MKKDIVFGAITGYNWEQIEPWVISLERSGFTGHKVMIVYDIDKPVIEKLVQHGFSIMGFKQEPDGNMRYPATPGSWHIVVTRFREMWQFLRNIKLDEIRYIISTDVKDVVFQTNPSDWLEKNLGEGGGFKVNVGSEGLKYKDEPWGRDNMKAAFGEAIYAGQMQERTIINAGTIAGDAEYMRDLFLQVYTLSVNNAIHNPDQAALNLILSSSAWADVTLVNQHEDGWCAQCGTTVDPTKINEFLPKLEDQPPVMIGDIVYPMIQLNHENCDVELKPGKEPFCLVHQYDRVPVWKIVMETKYKEEQNNGK